MNPTEIQLANSTIERWVKAVTFFSTAYTNPEKQEPMLKVITLEGLYDESDEIAKRSKPSYTWHEDEFQRWYRIWFKEDNLTIQFDLHQDNGAYIKNEYEIALLPV